MACAVSKDDKISIEDAIPEVKYLIQSEPKCEEVYLNPKSPDCAAKPKSYRDALLKNQPKETKRADAQPQTKVKDTPDTELPGIWIFVDDSNIWIGAMKLQSSRRGFKTGHDHRVRIDIGKLTDAVAGGRPVAQGTLYGSEPPALDTVWKKIRSFQNWKVDSHHRSRITGKEKQVDTKLVAEVTRIAIKTPEHERSTIVIVTGDADVIPGLDEVIREDRWKIEIYMWKQSIAKDLYRFASDHKDRITIKKLDDYLSEVTFTSMKFDILRAKSLKSKVKESGVVFTMVRKAFGNRVPTEAWCDQLEKITQWPFQYYWFERSGSKTNHLVVLFQEDKDAGRFDIAEFMDLVQHSESSDDRKKYRLPKVKDIQPFLQFSEEEFREKPGESIQIFDKVLEQVGIYDTNDVHDGHDSDVKFVSENSDKWSSVEKKSRKVRKPLYSEECENHFNCRIGTRCPYHHSKEEKQYFCRRKEGCGNPKRKVHLCNNFDAKRCKRKAENCEYAHGEDDAWCLQCKLSGHLTDKCPNEEEQHRSTS